MDPFTPMHTVIPEGTKGAFAVSHFEFGQPSARMMIGKDPMISPGKYVQLVQMDGNFNNRVWMSDTDNEQRTNTSVIRHAKGDVLIAGLGIGMIVLPIFRKPEVQTITIVEKHQEVIELVLPALQAQLEKEAGPMAPHRVHRSFRVLHADIYTWEAPKGAKWDCIYFDIWGDQSTDALNDMAKLKRRFARRKRPDGWMGCWRESELRVRRERERRSGW